MGALGVGEVGAFAAEEFGAGVVDHGGPGASVDHLVRGVVVGHGERLPGAEGQAAELDAVDDLPRLGLAGEDFDADEPGLLEGPAKEILSEGPADAAAPQIRIALQGQRYVDA